MIRSKDERLGLRRCNNKSNGKNKSKSKSKGKNKIKTLQ